MTNWIKATCACCGGETGWPDGGIRSGHGGQQRVRCANCRFNCRTNEKCNEARTRNAMRRGMQMALKCYRCKATEDVNRLYPVGTKRVPLCSPCSKDCTLGVLNRRPLPPEGKTEEMFPDLPLVAKRKRNQKAGA